MARTRTANSDNRNSPKLDDKLIDEFATLGKLAYAQRRKLAAKELGVRVDVLDRLVKDRRRLLTQDDTALPHWKVNPSPEPVDAAELLKSIQALFRRYVVLPKGADVALPLWVLHAWTFDAGDISPFMVVNSPTKRCGKTTVLILLYFLTPKSELVASITASSLFRYIEQERPTLIIDEADTFMGDNEELRGILNSGHTKTAANVIRNVEVEGEHRPRRFSTWAPKVIAAIGSLADTLEDRSIILLLQRKPRTAKVDRLRRRDTSELAGLRSQAARWAADNFDLLIDPDPQIPSTLNDRAADNWRPLLAIADLAGGTWLQDARDAACHLSGDDQDGGAVNVDLLKDIRTAFGEDAAIRSADLVAKLIADPERPWVEWKRGRPLTQKQLGRLLKPFGICSETVHPPGLPHGRGYQRVRFEEVWEAYCPLVNTPPNPNPPISKCASVQMAMKSAQPSDFRSVQKASPHTSKNDDLSYRHAGLHACTLRKQQNGVRGYVDRADDPDPIPDFPVCAPKDNGGAAPGLSEREIHEFAARYIDRAADRLHEDGGIELDRGKLDASLREALRERCLPEHVETEFLRIMDAVFRV